MSSLAQVTSRLRDPSGQEDRERARSPIRLLIVSNEFPPGPGGIGTHCYQLALQLHRLGWDVLVLTSQDYCSEEEAALFRSEQPFRINAFPAQPGRPTRFLARWRILSRSIRERRPDLVIATGTGPVLLVSWAARLNGLRWVAVGHGTEFGRAGGWETRLIRNSFRRATAVVSVSRYTRERMESIGISHPISTVIPNGADASRFKALAEEEVHACRERLGLQNAQVLLTVGNVTDRKGQEIVIRALPSVLSAAPAAHYVIAGLPTKREALERLARELGVSERVHFLGRVSDGELVPLVNACDVFVMTSRETADGDFEGYGIAVVEAALCGKPSVVSAGSGLAEAIVPGETGLLVPQANLEATAEALRSLLMDDERRQKLGKAARARALAEQTWEQRIREYESFLRRILTRSELSAA